MKLLILFATIEGQTRKIADHLAQAAEEMGHTVVMHDADTDDVGLALGGVDRVVLAASVHRRRHPQSFEKLVQSQADALKGLPTLLYSVSLCAAFDEGLKEAQTYVDEMCDRTGFVPSETVLVGGALQFDKYQDYEAWIVRYIALGLRNYDKAEGDREFTDWDALTQSLSAYVSS
ncbi:MAG: flavodoxin domain-containing protein [Pseudomonadota bacterium]